MVSKAHVSDETARSVIKLLCYPSAWPGAPHEDGGLIIGQAGRVSQLGNTVEILFGVSFHCLRTAGDMSHAALPFVGHILIRKETRKAGSFWDWLCVRQFSSLNLTVLECLLSGSSLSALKASREVTSPPGLCPQLLQRMHFSFQ